MQLTRAVPLVSLLLLLFTQLSTAGVLTSRQSPIKFLICGDSISHGSEGDYTWRYRLWQWLRQNNVNFDFVGPYKGTLTPTEPKPPQPPRSPGEPEPADGDLWRGSYALDVDPAFDTDHFTQSRRQIAQMVTRLADQVSQYNPDYVLIELGFNDVGWLFAEPASLLETMRQIVENARRVKPNLRFAIADIPYRTRINGREDLPVRTDGYNALLRDALSQWSTSTSPIHLVRFRENYSSGCDGLHPNVLGEYQIAQAFSRVLNTNYGFGSSALDVPANLPVRSCPPVQNLRATPTPYGIVTTWDRVFGARGYKVMTRRSALNRWDTVPYTLSMNRHDTIWTLDGEVWDYQVQTSCGDGDNQKSPWVGPVTATSNPTNPLGPKNIVINPGPRGVSARWDPPDGNYVFDRYEFFAYDTDRPCNFPRQYGTRSNSITINDLEPGHNYMLYMNTWTSQGVSKFPTFGNNAITGSGMPPVPANFKVTVKDALNVQLTWDVSAPAQYKIWLRDVNNATDVSHYTGTSTIERCFDSITYGGSWIYEWCVNAANGNLESPKTTCITPPYDESQWQRSLAPCTARPVVDCGFGKEGNGGSGGGQPGEDGGDGGGGGGSPTNPTNPTTPNPTTNPGNPGNNDPGSGEIYIDPSIWSTMVNQNQDPTVSCAEAPCTFILPPLTLPTPTTYDFTPYTTDLEVAWQESGRWTRITQRTTISLPPLTTNVITFYPHTLTVGGALSFSPTPRVTPPLATITNDPNPLDQQGVSHSPVTRTITPRPYPTDNAQHDDDNDDDDRSLCCGDWRNIGIDTGGGNGPICAFGCGTPCPFCGPGPCPPTQCPGPPGGDQQDPEDPDKDDDDDDDDDDEEEPRFCPIDRYTYPPSSPDSNPNGGANSGTRYSGEYPGPGRDPPEQPEDPDDPDNPDDPDDPPTGGPLTPDPSTEQVSCDRTNPSTIREAAILTITDFCTENRNVKLDYYGISGIENNPRSQNYVVCYDDTGECTFHKFSVRAKVGCAFTIGGPGANEDCGRKFRKPLDQCNTGGEDDKQGGSMNDNCSEWIFDILPYDG